MKVEIGHIVELDNGRTTICFDKSNTFTYLAPYNKENGEMDLTDVLVYSDLDLPPIETILTKEGVANE